MHQLPIVSVTAAQAEQLDYANRVITTVRDRMRYGAGNQSDDLARTENWSSRFTARVYEVYDHVYAGLSHQNKTKPKLLAGIADRYSAGNCDMAGAMAFTIMRGMLPDIFEIMFIRGKGHTYAAFKMAAADDSTAIIVDPWPTSAIATLANHHFMGFRGNPHVYRKRGKGRSQSEPDVSVDRILLNAKYRQLAGMIDDDLSKVHDLPSASFPVYSHNLASNEIGGYRNPNGDILATPVARLMLPPPPLPSSDPDVQMSDG